MLSLIIAIVIALLILSFAYFFYRTVLEIFQEDDTFWRTVGGFLILYIFAVVGLYALLPSLPKGADLSSLTRLINSDTTNTILTQGEGEIIELQ